MKSLRFLCLSSLMMFCLLNSGCDLTLGPKTKTVYTLVYEGKPMEVVESAKVKGIVLDGTGDAVTQDVGGWGMMPKTHWQAVQRALEAKK